MGASVKFPVFVDANRRFAVQVDENPRYTRLLTLGPGGIDVIKFLPYQMKRWYPYADVPHAALRYVHTFARSTLSKTYRAVRAMEEVMQELDKLSMPELVAEFNRLSGKDVKRFSSKAAALKAIRKLTPIINGTAAPEPKLAANDEAQQSPKENDMGTTKKTTKTKTTKTSKPTKTASKKAPAAKKPRATSDAMLERAKKIAKMAETSAGGLIVKMLKERAHDDEKILSTVLNKFPGSAATTKHVSWYRSMLTKAGVTTAIKG